MSLLWMISIRLDGLLQREKEKDTAEKYERAHLARLQEIVQYCHKEKSWGVDVHDKIMSQEGAFKKQIERLNHSDLIVLDYHLADDGEQARDTIKALSQNCHFNMVLVHTQAKTSADLATTFDEILLPLTCDVFPALESIFSDEEKESTIEGLIDDHNPELKYLLQRLPYKEVFSLFCLYKRGQLDFESSQHSLHGFIESLREVLKEYEEISLADIAHWHLRKQIESFKNQGLALNHAESSSPSELPKHHWTEKFNYIATGTIFISVIAKKDGQPEEELMKPLQQALQHYKPTPMHLLMVKIRTLIEDKGIEFALEIMKNEKLQIAWLRKILGASNLHEDLISAIWEDLNNLSRETLQEYLHEMISMLNKKEASSEEKIDFFLM